MSDTEINKVVKKLIEKSDLTSYYIAKKTGITEQSIINYRKGVTKPTRANANLLKYFFEDIERSAKVKAKDKQDVISYVDSIPLIPSDIMLDFCNNKTQILEHSFERYVVPVFKDAEFLMSVRGSTMFPNYNSGDIVACKSLSLTDIFFQYNKVYAINTNQGVLVNRIKKGRDDNHILVVSDNEKYEPFQLNIKNILAIAIVTGTIRLE